MGVASVKKRPKTSFFVACYKLPTGKLDARGRPIFRRVQRSTGTADESRALQLAISYERAAQLAGEQRFTERAAHAFLAEVRAVTAAPAAGSEAIDAFLRRWFAGRKRALAPASRDRYQLAIDQLTAHLGPRAQAPLGDVTPREVADFRDAQTRAGKSPATVNKALGILALAFDEAKLQHGLAANPFRGLNVKGAKRHRQHRRAFTFEQFRALVAATPPADTPDGRKARGDGMWRRCPEEWRTLLLLGGYTGGRQQELAKLDWTQIDLPGHRLWLNRTKTSDDHAMPLHPALERHLRATWAAAGRPRAGPLLPTLAGEQRRAISNTVRRVILPAIGIHQAYATASEEKGQGRRLAPYSFHSLRHSLSTWLDASGIPEDRRMRLIGHEDQHVNRGYTHPEFAQAAADLAKVPSVSA